MRLYLLIIFVFLQIPLFGQIKNGTLLLLKVEKKRDLKIEPYSEDYLVVELDSTLNIKGKLLSKPIYFKDFTDQAFFSCLKNDSISLKTIRKKDTYDLHTNIGLKNFNIINENSYKMKHLMSLNIKSALYNQKIKISYVFIRCDFCSGFISKYDSNLLNYFGEIVIVGNTLVIDNDTKIPKENLYEIVKSINFNSSLW